MTSREFIQKQFGNADGKSRSLSSVCKDANGQIYSYGYHYPLLFQAGGLTFRNTGGYSSTTAKHISWCWDLADIDVKLSGCNQYAWRNSENSRKVPYLLHARATFADGITDNQILAAVLNDLIDERTEIKTQMDSKKRKDTNIYRTLAGELLTVSQSMRRVEGALK